jgi:hypothetical protein
MPDLDHRTAVRDRLLELAEADPAVAGAAITGSDALDAADAWSDIDLAFGIDDHELGPTLDRWTTILLGQFAAVHHWDLPAGRWIYRAFLLPDGLEVDLGFVQLDGWGPRAASWRTVFGTPAELDEPSATPDADFTIGLAWHHVRHARVCLERDRLLQADYWIGATRALVIQLACRRQGLPTSYAKGAHLLPAELQQQLAESLPRSIDSNDQRRALRAVTALLSDQLELEAPDVAARLQPVLATWVG